ncbi:maleylpyruvate isomerase N-terminal domain-containing protein [Gordonia sp. GN26]
MNAPTTPPDPRPAFTAATTWVTGLLSAVTAEQLDAPTPCDEFDVRTLGAHLLATAQRAAALPEGGRRTGHAVHRRPFRRAGIRNGRGAGDRSLVR